MSKGPGKSKGPRKLGARITNPLGQQQVGHRIPETPAIDKPMQFRHFVLTMTRGRKERNEALGLPPRSLVFFKVERTPKPRPKPANQAEAEALAKRIVDDAPDAYPYKRATSFDFDKSLIPGWVLLELDPTINWQFPIDHPGATTKGPDRSEVTRGAAPLNANLRYVHIENGKPVVTETAPEDGCRFILFAALDREFEGSRIRGQKFNFIVEFYQQLVDGDGLQTIPIIIDPDFPSDGPPDGG